MDVIKVKDVSKYYGDFLAVKGISFNVEVGEIFGFLGPNGAGKTTTIRMLTGIIKPSSGEIKVLGYDMADDREKIKAREKMGIVPEMANPYIDLTALQNLRLVGELYGMRRRDVDERSLELLRLFSLYEKRDKKVRTFSKGLKQRLSLAMAMLPDPDILFLDEPTSGLDVMSARMIKEIIKEENKRGKTIFMSTHNMADANELCSRVAIINYGRIAAIDTPDGIRSAMKGTVIEFSTMPMKIAHGIFEGEKVEVLGDKVRVYTEDADFTLKKIVRWADENGLKILTLETKKPSLEDVFIRIVGDKND